MNSIIGLKNYISVISKRIDAGEEVTNTELVGFLNSLCNSVTEIELTLNSLREKIREIEGDEDIPKNHSSDAFVQMVLNKIEILKNMIKAPFGSESSFFSTHLIKVESIEQTIKKLNTVTSNQLAELNEIYKLQESINFSS